jgi:hypothetical protein
MTGREMVNKIWGLYNEYRRNARSLDPPSFIVLHPDAIQLILVDEDYTKIVEAYSRSMFANQRDRFFGIEVIKSTSINKYDVLFGETKLEPLSLRPDKL